MPSAGTSTNLTNSTTTVPKATYVPLKVPQDERTKTALARSGGAVRKSGFIRGLNLQSGEVDAVSAALTSAGATWHAPSPLIALAKSFEGSTIPSALPTAAQFASVPDADVVAFANALVGVRRKAVTDASARGTDAADEDKIAAATNLYNTALVGANTSSGSSDSTTSPIGMLNLERIEMTPAGVERGGLIATIPLAPKERTVVVQQEWSVITQEFTSIVTDSLDNYSETGVTDNTQLSQSTTSQVAHSNQFNINSSVSGSYGFVTASVATGFATQDQSSQSATDSRQHSVQTTQKASSRSTQSHKTTISTSTTTGSSNANTRMLENPSATDPMRIDYFSIMRKWYCALYRYGLRLTYDVTVPEPGATMREIYEQLAVLQQSAGEQFVFDIKHSDITADVKSGESEPHYLVLADRYSVDAPPPPSPAVSIVQVGPVYFSNTDNVKPVTFTVPNNYWIQSITSTAQIGDSDGANDPLFVIGTTVGQFPRDNPPPDLCAGNSYLWHQSGTLSITILYVTSSSEHSGELFFSVNCVPTDTAMAQWQSTVWSALYNAAQNQFYAQQQQIAAQITALQDKITNVDTLTLRREENDEIMKCALRWLLGDNFEFMPKNVVNLFKKASGANEQYGVAFTGNDTGLTSNDWSIVKQNEDRINFINQAIDWDNVIYFVYSYFWDDPRSWDFIRQIQHPDSTRQAFLRAGSARIVLTVRQGWELAWTYFVEFGSTSMPNPLPSHPYLTIAQQIQDYDSINYPGIPPADPDGGGPIDDGTPQVGTTCDIVLSPTTSPVTIAVADSTGFVAGATAIIDTWESGAMEYTTITGVPDATHIIVQALGKAHDPAQNQNQPYPIVQAGESGLLIAEWFEYTPTSGVDIAVTSNLATIA
ncbi:MAG TPA: hypothetical protein VGG57_08630 [Stellaceae bacterium]|jgi:hypothetical protein